LKDYFGGRTKGITARVLWASIKAHSTMGIASQRQACDNFGFP
jgi:hypothetical protein